MMTPEELKEFLDLCKKVLDNDKTGYKRDKEFIQKFFTDKDPFKDRDHFEQVRRRLILIDALYSTQVGSKRLYGIDELAKKICELSDTEWVKKFNECLTWEDEKWLAKGDNEPVKNLFNETYGREKSGKKKHCISLISKYAYFLCGFNFPIYDSLVIKNFNTLLGAVYPDVEIDRMPQRPDVEFEDFIKCLRKLKGASRLSYKDIDYILWTYGKLKEQSLSSIVTGIEYENFFHVPYAGVAQNRREDLLMNVELFTFEDDAKNILNTIVEMRQRPSVPPHI